ncbi:hypothetical protein [Pleomorphomonas sp. NRK KF1]|uniref:DoxX family protein n=1 Tax=Pleomorphomonas sp. NRK KF1 TaxID=2943000 RepID=UPI002042E3CB|nr:hypothetical protein [Pleomorphomonas sp. NRK KF1]MCM5551650.1 hypothetical protein [Pleomorphomonas sp. NRK KF1]
MLFFALLSIISVVASVVGWLVGVPLDAAAAVRWGLSASLLFFGIDHLITPQRYLPMMPSLIPAPRAVVLVTGLCEIAGGLGLWPPELRSAAGWALAVYFVCVFPANIKNAVGGLSVDGLPSSRIYYWVRLPFQPVAIWAALFAAEITRWPVG